MKPLGFLHESLPSDLSMVWVSDNHVVACQKRLLSKTHGLSATFRSIDTQTAKLLTRVQPPRSATTSLNFLSEIIDVRLQSKLVLLCGGQSQIAQQNNNEQLEIFDA